MLTTYRIADRRLESFSYAASAAIGEFSDIVWCDLQDPSEAERAFVNQAARVNIPSLQDMEEIEVSSRLYDENDAAYMTITVILWMEEDIGRKTPVLFILTRATLVTVRYAPLKAFENVSERFSRSADLTVQPAERIFLALLDALVDRFADALEMIGDSLDAMSQKIFRPEKSAPADKRDRDLQKIIKRVGHKGDLLGRARESLVSIHRLAGYYASMRPEDDQAKAAPARIAAIQRDVASLSDHATYLTEKATFLLDATLGLISVEQNQIIKIFSIVGVCLMPPTVVASIYGMNFKFMPELEFHYGYPLALLAMVVSGVLPYLYFKRKGWF